MERLSGNVSHPCRDRSGLTNAGVAGGVVGALVAADYFWPGSSSSTLIPLFTRSLSLSLLIPQMCFLPESQKALLLLFSNPTLTHLRPSGGNWQGQQNRLSNNSFF